MSSLNKVMLIGNVGKDPEIRTIQNGSRVANLSVATSEKWKDKASGEYKEKTEWHRVTIWNDNLVGLVERFVKKGSKLYLEGSIETRKWTDDSGKDNYSTEIVLKAFNGSIVLLESREPASNAETRRTDHLQTSAQVQSPNYADDLDDSLPF